MQIGINSQITHEGVTLTVREWGERLKINLHTIVSRLKRGMTAEEAFTKPIRPTVFGPKMLHRAFGTEKTLSEWSKLTGTPISTIRGGLRRGGNLEEILGRGRVRKPRTGKPRKGSGRHKPEAVEDRLPQKVERIQTITLLISYEDGREVTIHIPKGAITRISTVEMLFGGENG